jgi:hypothetical protein
MSGFIGGDTMRVDSKENGLFAVVARLGQDAGRFAGYWVVEYWDGEANMMVERTRHATAGTAAVSAIEFVNGMKSLIRTMRR